MVDNPAVVNLGLPPGVPTYLDAQFDLLLDARAETLMSPNVDYDAIAQSYDRRYLVNDYSGVAEALVAFIGQDARTRALEVGCGTGHWLRLIAARDTPAAGLDASEKMLACARAQAPSVSFVRGVAEQLPWPHEAFDRVFCINALHHFRDKVRFLSEARRVLRQGGQIMAVGLDPHVGIDH